MSVTTVTKDPERLTLTVTSQYDVTAERAWQLWADPRQLERWWGPPTYPATVEDHNLKAGGHVGYFMTGPDGDTPHGYWNVLEAEAPRRLVVEDGFADQDGKPAESMPVTVMTVEISDRPGGVTMTVESRFPSAEAMQQLLDMGMEEGITEAAGQIDAVLASS
jgi:uncharacterized protein YndB with AHSA1/START domain